MSKKKMKIGRVPVDPIAIRWVLFRNPGQWLTRLEIAELLGREKTSHVIRQIEAAVQQGLIVREAGTDPKGRQCWYYIGVDINQNQAA